VGVSLFNLFIALTRNQLVDLLESPKNNGWFLFGRTLHRIKASYF